MVEATSVTVDKCDRYEPGAAPAGAAVATAASDAMHAADPTARR
jgi:hypothetical protein